MTIKCDGKWLPSHARPINTQEGEQAEIAERKRHSPKGDMAAGDRGQFILAKPIPCFRTFL